MQLIKEQETDLDDWYLITLNQLVKVQTGKDKQISVQQLKALHAKILVIVAFFRELLGSGTLLGFNILNYEPLQKIGYVNNGLMLMPPMALILCACIIWYQRERLCALSKCSYRGIISVST